MFSVSMNKAVQSAQECLNNCINSENISNKVTEDINSFTQLINVIDPSDIDFSNNSFFYKIYIKKYWKNFNNNYFEIDKIMKNFPIQLKIIKNTIVTLETHQKKLSEEFKNFSKGAEQLYSDFEYAQQYTVSENMIFVFNNILNDYKILCKKLENIINISNIVFETFIINTKTQYINNFKKEDLQKYKINFSNLKNILSDP